MILKNLTLLTNINLPHDLLWVDEHSWSPVVSSIEYSLTGALLIDSGVKQAGREITLQSPELEMAWVTRSVVDLLRAWSVVAGQTFLLTLEDGREFTVVFRHHDAPAVEANPVSGIASFDPDSWWKVTLKLMEI